MGLLTKYLIDLLPRTGRMIDESGGFINEADLTRGLNAGALPPVAMATDRQGRAGKISQKGEQLVGMMFDDVNINFQYGIRPADVGTILSGTGTAGTIKSMAAISPGTGVGSAQIISLEPVRYRGGHESYAEKSFVFRTPESNLNQYGGFLNNVDRLCVGYQDATFGILLTEGGNETFVALADANIDKLDGSGPSRYIINPLAANVYRLAFVWHGALPLTIEVQYKQQWWPVHAFDFSNIITETHLENPHLPIGMLVERTAGTGTDEAFKSGSWRGGAISSSATETSAYWTAHTVLDYPLINARNNIFTIVNPLTWKGKINHVVYELGIVTFDSAANKTVAVYGVTGATITGGGTLTDIDLDNSPIQFIDGGTLTGGTRGPATVIKAGGDRRTDVRGTGIRLYPGKQFSFDVDPGGAVNGTFSISSRWRGDH